MTAPTEGRDPPASPSDAWDRTDEPAESERRIVPGRTLRGLVSGTFAAPGRDFETTPVDRLALSFRGIEGDLHAGHLRRSSGREPWYPRGTELRNERQLSLVSPEDLRRIASRLGLEAIRPEWLGANLSIEGIPDLSWLPAGSLLFFAAGATLKIDGQNRPCRIAGRRVGLRAGAADPTAIELAFAKMARRLRGLVAWVEKPGEIRPGDAVTVRVPEQWVY